MPARKRSKRSRRSKRTAGSRRASNKAGKRVYRGGEEVPPNHVKHFLQKLWMSFLGQTDGRFETVPQGYDEQATLKYVIEHPDKHEKWDNDFLFQDELGVSIADAISKKYEVS